MLGRSFRIVGIVITIGIVLTACQNKTADYRNEYDATTDFSYMFQMQGDGIFVVPTEEGYYFLNDSLLYYADKSTMKPVLLDNRPENDCLEPSNNGTVQNCQAYVKHDPMFRHNFLGYHDGKLYALESGQVWGKDNENQFKTMLIELSEDGSKRKVRMEFDSVPKSMAIHRGTLYYSLRNYDKESQATSQLMQVSLSGSNKPKAVYTGSDSNSTISDILPYGKNIYFYEVIGQAITIKRYDREENSVTRLFTNDDGEIPLLRGIYEDRLLYTVNLPSAVDMLRNAEHLKVYSSDLEGGDHTELPIERTFKSIHYVSEKYFYARPSFQYLLGESTKDQFNDIRHELTVYDGQYNVVDVIDLSFLPIDHSFMIGDESFMFIQFIKDGKKVMQYLDKSEFGTGKATFKPLLESPILS